MPASVLEMPQNIAALLPKVRRKPLSLARNGKTVAVLISARTYDDFEEIIERAQFSDKILDMYADRIESGAKKDGTLGKEASLKLLADIAEAINAEEDRWCLKLVEKGGDQKPIGAAKTEKLLNRIAAAKKA